MPTTPATFPSLVRLTRLIAGLLFLCVFPATGDTLPADSPSAADLLRRADTLSARQRFDSAAACLAAAREIFDRQGQAESTLVCCNRLAYNFLLQARFQEAGYQLRAADSVTQVLSTQGGHEAVQTLYLKGYRSVYLDSLDAAMMWLRQALNLAEAMSGNNHRLVANCNYMLALAYHRKGLVDSALACIWKDLAICRQEGGTHARETALALTELGDLKRTAGDTDSAVACLAEALDLLRTDGLEKTTYACSAHLRLGTALYAGGKLLRAVAHFDTAAALARRLFGDEQVLTASVYASLGDAYAELGEWSRATSCLQLALAVFEHHYGHHHSSLAGLYDKLAKNYLEQDSLPQARTAAGKAIRLERSLFGEKRADLGGMYETLALTSQKEGKHHEALVSFDQAHRIFAGAGMPLHRQLSRLSIESSSSFTALGLPDSARARLEAALSTPAGTDSSAQGQSADACRMLGGLYEQAGDTGHALRFYDRAIALTEGEPQFVQEYIRAGLAKAALLSSLARSQGTDRSLADLCARMIAVIEKARAHMREEESKMTFSQYALPFCEIGIQACLRLHVQHPSRAYLDTAFAFAEYGKARVLMESLEKEAALRLAGVPGSALLRQRSLTDDVASASVLLKRARMGLDTADEAALRRLEAKRLGALQDLSQWQDSLLAALPGLQALTGPPGPVPMRELHASLSPGTCLVEYFIGKSSACAFLLLPAGIEVVDLGKPDDLAQATAGCLESIRTVAPVKYFHFARALYRRLLSPLEPYLRTTTRLIFVPDWSLAAIPFEALLTRPVALPPAAEEIDFSRLPYLVKRFDVSYAYSASFLLHARHARTAADLVDGLVGFAPVNYRLPALENSGRELRSIAAMFRRAGKPAKTFLGKDATKENFKTACSAYAYVHVATHGILDPVNPRLSTLLFTDAGDGTAHDNGLLYGEEAYNLSLGAKLVTLSSCESGVGKMARGEGLLALTRGFFYAGASNVLSSLWKVPDESTKDLMLAFYRHALRGMNFARSIRRAKLNLIASPPTAFPREWAGFILIGA